MTKYRKKPLFVFLLVAVILVSLSSCGPDEPQGRPLDEIPEVPPQVKISFDGETFSATTNTIYGCWKGQDYMTGGGVFYDYHLEKLPTKGGETVTVAFADYFPDSVTSVTTYFLTDEAAESAMWGGLRWNETIFDDNGEIIFDGWRYRDGVSRAEQMDWEYTAETGILTFVVPDPQADNLWFGVAAHWKTEAGEDSVLYLFAGNTK